MSHFKVQQSTLWYNLKHFKLNKHLKKENQMSYGESSKAKMKENNTQNYHCTIIK